MNFIDPPRHTRRAFLRRSTQLAAAGTALPFALNLAALGEAAIAVATTITALQAPSPLIPSFAPLAGRLQAARSEGVSVAAWLAVQAGGRDYLLPLNQAGEIFPWTGVQPVPYTQAWFLGIANLRGALMGV